MSEPCAVGISVDVSKYLSISPARNLPTFGIDDILDRNWQAMKQPSLLEWYLIELSGLF